MTDHTADSFPTFAAVSKSDFPVRCGDVFPLWLGIISHGSLLIYILSAFSHKLRSPARIIIPFSPNASHMPIGCFHRSFYVSLWPLTTAVIHVCLSSGLDNGLKYRYCVKKEEKKASERTGWVSALSPTNHFFYPDTTHVVIYTQTKMPNSAMNRQTTWGQSKERLVSVFSNTVFHLSLRLTCNSKCSCNHHFTSQWKAVILYTSFTTYDLLLLFLSAPITHNSLGSL